MAQNHRHLRGGLPDNMCIRSKSKDCSFFEALCAEPEPEDASADISLTDEELDGLEIKFVEVKGPRDRLADKQRLWLNILVQAGVQAEVCHVYEEKPKKRRLG